MFHISCFMLQDENNSQETLRIVAQDILSRLGYEAEVNIFINEKDPALKVVAINSANNLSALIGKNGQNIKALEQVIRLLYLKKMAGEEKPVFFAVDLNDYRKLRSRQIIEKAMDVANRVRISKKAEALLPMSSYERRLIHVELSSCPDIETESIGEEPKRRIVIKPLII